MIEDPDITRVMRSRAQINLVAQQVAILWRRRLSQADMGQMPMLLSIRMDCTELELWRGLAWAKGYPSA
jgi:hypothetical protein